MILSAPFIRRPVGTTLMAFAIALAGAIAYFFLPVSPLPQVDFPSISVSASLPGGSPETMASSVATPLERQLGQIAGVAEMTSVSTLGQTSITIVFDLTRNIDAAARDVQAAINAASAQLPSNLPSLPHYRKVNPADAPIMIITLSSDTFSRGALYDSGSTILSQSLSQIDGIGQVFVGGGALPAVRVEINPAALNALNLGLDDVRIALAAANINRPRGDLTNDKQTWILTGTDQLMKAAEYKPLIIAYHNGAPVRLSDVADVVDSVEDIHTAGLFNGRPNVSLIGKPAVSLIVFRQPGANIIDAVERVKARLPQLQAAIPAGMVLNVVADRTTTIRASVHDVEITLLISISLVILVVFLFLRDFRSTLIPSVAVPISLLGTFAIMYLLDYSIDNLSLMAFTVATGFVVDDAIVVLENITRHIESGMSPRQAALKGAKEIGFTVVSISISLVAVFIPIFMMGGIVGRLFREFAVTLSVAIGVSLLVSLTLTPMMCATLLKYQPREQRSLFYRAGERVFNFFLNAYEIALRFILRHRFVTLIITLCAIVVTVFLYRAVPKSLFPQQDTGRFIGSITADQTASSDTMVKYLDTFTQIVYADPAVEGYSAYAGGGRGTNTAAIYVTLKPLAERKVSTDQVVARLRAKTAGIPGAKFIANPIQDLRTAGGRQSKAQYQYTLQADDFATLTEWAPKLLERMESLPGIADLNSDQQNSGLQTSLDINRTTASQLGLSASDIDNLLYSAFGQRQVSTIYRALNQYHVVMEVDPKYARTDKALNNLYAISSNGAGRIPLKAFATFNKSAASLGVNHQGQFPAITLSFNLLPGFSLGTAVTEVQNLQNEMGMPASIRGSFAGTAQAFQEATGNLLWMILAALVAVYLILGMLYESLIHPITIISTIPSAFVGALLALLLFKTDLSVFGFIGIILLIGIVKKNAIMLIDFAIEAQRSQNLTPEEAIYKAALLRFRPIMMTTAAALLGGLPLALGTGVGSELRRPLGLAIVGGLIVSQALTIFTTPVIYLYLDKFRLFLRGRPDSPRPLLDDNHPKEIAPA